MPTFSMRVSDADLRMLREEASRRGMSVSRFVKESVGLRAAEDEQQRSDFERRLVRLERMAGL